MLGLSSGATVDDVRQARNRLAKEYHPDVGGSADRMQAVNEAAAAALQLIEGGRRPAPATPPAGRRAHSRQTTAAPRRGRVERDHPSFTIEALPAEAFEALMLAGQVLGGIADDEPPYRLDLVLDDPRQVWCRAELVPDGGGSTVSLTVATPPGEVGPAPPVDAAVYEVRDRLLEELNALDWTTDGPRPRPNP